MLSFAHKMGRRILLVLIVVVLAGVIGAAQARRPRLLLISIDGLQPSSYLDESARSTTLGKLAARGAWATGVTGVWPTNTRPSHASLLTGVPPAVHGIIDNDVLDPEGRTNSTFNWFARDIKVPTLATAARAAGRSTAVVMWPLSVGLEATWLVPTFNWQHPRDQQLLRSLSTPRLLEDFERDVAVPFAWPPTDRQRAELTSFIARTHRPDLQLLYFGTLDEYQHTYGPADPMTASVLRDINRLIDQMLSALDAQKLLDDTYVAVVSDHGYVSVAQAVAPNAAFKQAGLIETDARGRISAWQAFSHGEGGSSLVYVKDPGDPVLLSRVRGLLDSLAIDPRAGIERILDRAALEAAGTDPAAAFGIEMKEGFTLTKETGPLFGPPYIHSMHGYPPSHPSMHASFMIAGPGLAGLGDLGIVRMTQIAPTLARLLGVSLSPKADAPIEKIVSRLTAQGSGLKPSSPSLSLKP
jgi:predicted AlkP superfamily pyrophosphatase or phosphodiesterase